MSSKNKIKMIGIAILITNLSLTGQEELFLPNGTSSIGISENNNVGIGTDSPNQFLHVMGDIKIESDGGAELNLLNTSSGVTWQVVSGVSAGFEIGNVTDGLVDWDSPFYIKQNGYVGINTANPSFELDVNGRIRVNEYLRIGDWHLDDTNWPGEGGVQYNGGDVTFGISASPGKASLYVDGDIYIKDNNSLYTDYIYDDDDSVLRIQNEGGNTYFGGKVGIGIIPDGQLHIHGSYNKGLTFTGNNRPNIYLKKLNTDQEWSIVSGVNGRLYIKPASPNQDSQDTDAIISIDPTGKVAIGIKYPGIYQLAVNGIIGAEEIEVKQSIPDYVFDDDYPLRSIEEVEEFIDIEKHLPDIPSAKSFEMVSVPVGEMQSMHLKKIEELTLYLIEQNNQIKALQKQNVELLKRLTALEKTI
ncbi:hypothetical protein JW835_00245 [bacterium]|nr:hypothetical protein [bacterium]